MIGKFGLASEQSEGIVEAQDQVFDNCSNPQFVTDPNPWSNAVDEWDQARNQVPSLSSPPSFSGNCPAEKFQTAAAELYSIVLKMGTAYNNDLTDWILTFSALAQGNGTFSETLAHLRGRKGIDRFLLGSTAEKVVRESPKPVLTVRPEAKP